jgi:hypothetical protein
MKLTKTELKLLQEATRYTNGTVCVLTCYGKGCRIGGEGHRAFDALMKLRDKGLVGDTKSHRCVETRRGWSTHYAEYSAEITQEGRNVISCTCRPVTTIAKRTYYGGIDNCPVHGFGTETKERI